MIFSGGIVPRIMTKMSVKRYDGSFPEILSDGAFWMNACNSANGFPHTNKSGTTNVIEIEMTNPSNVVSEFLMFLRNINAMMIPKM